jgi:fumarate reductase flavoprotein subunit
MQDFDIIIVGAGTAGIPAAIEAIGAGARTLLVEQSGRVGGTLHVSAAQMSGADTCLQRERGIEDTVTAHVQDVIRISRGTCNTALVEKAASLGGATIDWLMSLGFDMDPVCPAILHFHEAYRTPRTYWGRDGGRSVLRVLLPLLDQAMAQPNASLLLNTKALSLTVGADGSVTGLRLHDAIMKSERNVRAGCVILATGGYAGNPTMFANLTNGTPLYTPALPIATGSGISMAEAIGALVRGSGHFIPTFAGIEEEPGTGRVLWKHLPNLIPQVRPPWEIYVDHNGRRFVQEDIDSIDSRERALMQMPDLTFWAVFDETALRHAPPLLPGWSPEELQHAWFNNPSFACAETLEALARQAGIDPTGLVATIDEFNRAQIGDPDPWGRLYRPAPIEVPPFRAIRMHGIVLKTPAGLATDTDLRVLSRTGAPIPNLYAIGEAMGGATLSGNAFVGGMSVTPALSFGRWLGQTLGNRVARVPA